MFTKPLLAKSACALFLISLASVVCPGGFGVVIYLGHLGCSEALSGNSFTVFADKRVGDDTAVVAASLRSLPQLEALYPRLFRSPLLAAGSTSAVLDDLISHPFASGSEDRVGVHEPLRTVVAALERARGDILIGVVPQTPTVGVGMRRLLSNYDGVVSGPSAPTLDSYESGSSGWVRLSTLPLSQPLHLLILDRKDSNPSEIVPAILGEWARIYFLRILQNAAWEGDLERTRALLLGDARGGFFRFHQGSLEVDRLYLDTISRIAGGLIARQALSYLDNPAALGHRQVPASLARFPEEQLFAHLKVEYGLERPVGDLPPSSFWVGAGLYPQPEKIEARALRILHFGMIRGR